MPICTLKIIDGFFGFTFSITSFLISIFFTMKLFLLPLFFCYSFYFCHSQNIDISYQNPSSIDVGGDYDLVMMRGTIEHFLDPIAVLKKCSEILKPGGILFITATPDGNSFAFNVYRHKWRLFTPYNHIHFLQYQM